MSDGLVRQSIITDLSMGDRSLWGYMYDKFKLGTSVL